jgi:CubicO group peptidase (beta-lactamase class C family)
MAADEGKLDITRPLTAYLPKSIATKMPSAQQEAYRHISLRRLMCMSVTGYPFRPQGESWVKDSLSYPLPHPDTPTFDYSNISAYLAGVAVANAVDENLYDYLCRKLFTPLGIPNPPAVFCPDGYFCGASGMELTVNELSRIGLLLYHSGEYEGRRLLSADYVREATSVQQMNREGGYGYFLWKYRDGFSINGKWKQKCYILPKEKLLVTYLSHIEDSSPALKESMEKHILGISG